MWRDGNGYLFTASYKLHTPAEPSDLQVDMILEYNMRKSICSNGSWFRFMRFSQLRCVLDGEQKIVKIWPVKGKGYEIGRLDTVNSIWYYALEKLGDHIGKQYYGGQRQLTPPLSDAFNKSMFSSIDIRPIKNHKLQSIYKLAADPKIRYPVDVKICTQEELFKGKKMITASVTFPPDKRIADGISMKFIHTTRGLKDVSKKPMKTFILYSGIKKAVQESIARYIRLKKYHSTATRIAPIKKVDLTQRKTQKPQQKPQNIDNPIIAIPCMA
jgi:hypothetical protein